MTFQEFSLLGTEDPMGTTERARKLAHRWSGVWSGFENGFTGFAEVEAVDQLAAILDLLVEAQPFLEEIKYSYPAATPLIEKIDKVLKGD